MPRAVLHGFYRSSAAFRVRIAIELKGLEVDRVSHQLRSGAQRTPEFLQLNPNGLVPVFVTEEGAILTESMAIIEYLDEVAPEPPLLPASSVARARVRALAHTIGCDVHPIQNLRVLNRLRAQFGAGEEATRLWACHFIALGFTALETELNRNSATGRFCHGDTPTLADICLVPQFYNARRFKLDLAPFPTLARIVEQCETVPAFQRARPDAQPDAE